ncbi:hypothetical protein ACTFIZ_004665 [Dictyostelium cf. discoideum]
MEIIGIGLGALGLGIGKGGAEIGNGLEQVSKGLEKSSTAVSNAMINSAETLADAGIRATDLATKRIAFTVLESISRLDTTANDVVDKFNENNVRLIDGFCDELNLIVDKIDYISKRRIDDALNQFKGRSDEWRQTLCDIQAEFSSVMLKCAFIFPTILGSFTVISIATIKILQASNILMFFIPVIVAVKKKIENSIPAGLINIFTGTRIPDGWSLCDGAPLNKLTYPELYQHIRDTFGSSEHEFSKPDFRGRCPIGAGNGVGLTNRVIGSKGGEENHLLTVSELPSHDHQLIDPGHSHSWHSIGGGFQNGPHKAFSDYHQHHQDIATTNVKTGITLGKTGRIIISDQNVNNTEN